MTTAEILRQARTLIEKHGWCQGAFGHPGGRTCAAGAIGLIEESLEESYSEPYLALECVIGNDQIIEWNDAGDRTIIQVLMKFDEAIELAGG